MEEEQEEEAAPPAKRNKNLGDSEKGAGTSMSAEGVEGIANGAALGAPRGKMRGRGRGRGGMRKEPAGATANGKVSRILLYFSRYSVLPDLG